MGEETGDEGSEPQTAPLALEDAPKERTRSERERQSQGAKSEESSQRDETPQRNTREDSVRPSALAQFHKQQTEFFAQKQQHAEKLAKAEKLERLLADGKNDPLAALEAIGYTDIKTFIDRLAVDGGRDTPERKELREMRQWRESVEAERQENQRQLAAREQQAQIDAQLENLRSTIKDRINTDEYANSLLRLKDADQQVMHEMDRIVTQTGKMPTPEEAMKSVETRMKGTLEEMAGNEAILEFFRSKLGANPSNGNQAAQSNKRANTRTIGGNARTPGLQHREDYVPSANGEEELQEAIRWARNLGY